jgi:hypothetical protein
MTGKEAILISRSIICEYNAQSRTTFVFDYAVRTFLSDYRQEEGVNY